MAMQIVRVVNRGSELKLSYGQEVYEFPTKGDRIVPYDAAAYWFGDPRVHNNPPRDWARREQYDKKRAQWGYALGFDSETKAEARNSGKKAEDSWEYKAPQFEVWS